jgi:hypothetical protein
MAGFNMPLQAIPPQLLAEMARAAFKPPALMSAGGGGGMGGGMGALPQSPGFNVGQGLAGMGQGLGMLAGALNQPSIEARTKGQVLSPSNPSYGDLGGPGGTYGQGGGFPGFFSGLFGRG